MRVAITASIAALAIGAILVGIATQGIAQGTYPSRDVRIVLPSTAGPFADVITRAIANKLSTGSASPRLRREPARSIGHDRHARSV